MRSIGVSNFYGTEIYDLLVWSEEPVSVIQNWFDPFNMDRETRKICAENNIRFMGFSTLGGYWKMLGVDFNPVFTSSTLTGKSKHKHSLGKKFTVKSLQKSRSLNLLPPRPYVLLVTFYLDPPPTHITHSKKVNNSDSVKGPNFIFPPEEYLSF